MRFWLLCCACLFGATQIYDWSSHQAWIAANLSLPWVMLGGIGLAIASNRLVLKAIFTQATTAKRPLPKASQTFKAECQEALIDPVNLPVNTQAQPRKPSISFEIPKKKRSPS